MSQADYTVKDWQERSLRLVGYFDLLQELQNRSDTVRGRELCALLRPSADPVTASERQLLCQESERFLDRHAHPAVGPGLDVRPAVTRAERGGTLTGVDLWAIGQVARAVRTLRDQVEEDDQRAEEGVRLERLLAEVGNCVDLPHLKQEIECCLTEAGEVRDEASPLLGILRTRIRSLASQVREKLEQFVHQAATSRWLQEAIVTQRKGRFVVPVRAEFRRQVPGLVHDTSASGQTVFVEPMPVLELNNRLHEAEGQEREEVERILRTLSQAVAGVAADLRTDVEVLGRVDRLFAMVRLGTDLHGTFPTLSSQPLVVLRGARHPALGDAAVPLDLEIGRSFRTLVVSGPNTGGKTVSLKTVGLMVAMAETGLRLPAEEGTICGSFDRLFVDIGDEQSIELSLSTFSSHMTAVVAYVRSAGERTLVLLDELGAGTDPTEGGALAMAILDVLHARKVRTIVTTHLSEVKRFAAAHAEVESGSVEFDLSTLRPTYRFHLGVPGQSNALIIAERLGLPSDVVRGAREHLDPTVRRAEDVLRQAAELRRRLGEQEAQAGKARQEAEQARDMVTAKLERLDAEIERRREQAAEKAREIVHKARIETQAAFEALRQAQMGRRGTEAAVAEARQRLSQAVPEDGSPPKLEGHALSHVVVGQTVRLKRLGAQGQVLEPPGPEGKALVQVGAVRLRLPLADLTDVEERARPDLVLAQSEGRPGAALQAAARQAVQSEMDLRGLRVDEALHELEAYLDRALLAGLGRVRLIHGKGTGALRQVVAERLAAFPGVVRYRLGNSGEGGDGVTVAELLSEDVEAEPPFNFRHEH